MDNFLPCPSGIRMARSLLGHLYLMFVKGQGEGTGSLCQTAPVPTEKPTGSPRGS